MWLAIRIALGALTLVLVGMSATATAAPRAATTVSVRIENFTFTPATITIESGDTIRWTNVDSAPHSAVTVEPGFVTVVLAQDQSTTTTFDRPGTYDYICGVHGLSMRGTVVVRGTPSATPRPTAGPSGHVVNDSFQEAFPDAFEAERSGGSPYLYASGALALLALVRVAWAVRHW